MTILLLGVTVFCAPQLTPVGEHKEDFDGDSLKLVDKDNGGKDKHKADESEVNICKFVEGKTGYTCQLTLANKKTSKVMKIIGKHIEGKSDSDVVTIKLVKGATAGEFPTILCEKFPNLKEMSLKRLGARKINENSLKNCQNLEKLDLKQNDLSINRITKLSKSVFENQSKLEKLYLAQNKLKTLPAGIFKPLVSIRKLNLKDNNLTTMSDEIFDSLTNLENLRLTGNKLATLNPKWFEHLTKLHTLTLGRNGISELPSKIFQPLINLKFFKVSNNNLTTISSESFGEHPNLKTFVFHTNQINSLDEQRFTDTVTDLYGKYNACVASKSVNMESKSGELESNLVTKEQLKKCFENFEEIDGLTTTTTKTFPQNRKTITESNC